MRSSEGSTHPLERNLGEQGVPMTTLGRMATGLSIAEAPSPIKSLHTARPRSVVLTLGRRAPVWPATVEHPKPARVSERQTRW